MRNVSFSENHWLRANRALNVPSVAMNGGIRRRVMSAPLRAPQAVPTTMPMSEGEHRVVTPSQRQLAHHDRRQDGDRADREIDARRQYDQRLGDGQRADDRDLGEDRREVGRREEALGEQAEVERRRGASTSVGLANGWLCSQRCIESSALDGPSNWAMVSAAAAAAGSIVVMVPPQARCGLSVARGQRCPERGGRATSLRTPCGLAGLSPSSSRGPRSCPATRVLQPGCR